MKREISPEKIRMAPKMVVAPCYDIEWHINHVKNKMTEAIGSWMMYHAPAKLKVNELHTLSNMLEDVLVPAMLNAYNHEHTADGYHFTEDKSPPTTDSFFAPPQAPKVT